MNNGESSSSGQAVVDLSSEFDADLDNWLKNYNDDYVMEEHVTNVSGISVDDITINPNSPRQPLMTTADASTYVGEGSSYMSHYGKAPEMMSSSSINSSSSNSGQILSSAIKTLSNHAAQSSQHQPLLQQGYNTKGVLQQHIYDDPFTTQSNILYDDQLRQLRHQPSNQSQNQSQLQQVTVAPGDLISVGSQQQRSNAQAIFSAPVGFKTSDEFPTTAAYREYLFEEICKLKVRYYRELQKMHRNATQRHTRATTTDDKTKFGNTIMYLERMMKFLSISNLDYLPKSDHRVSRFMNIIVNYMTYNMTDCAPIHQSTNGPLVQLQNPFQSAANLETNMVNFNQDFTSRTPQPEQSTMSCSSNNTSFPTHPINMVPKTSSVEMGSSSPSGWLSNATPTNVPSSSLDHQPPVVNENFSPEKTKQAMHKTNEFPKPKVRAGVSPLGSNLVSHYPPHQLSAPSSVNPVGQQIPVLSSRVDVNSLLSPQSIARSPFLLSSISSSPSGITSLTMVETQKHTTPTRTPCQEPQSSKDAVGHLTQVVRSISSKALICSLTDINSMEKATDIIPDCMPTNLVGQYIGNNNNNGSRPKVRRELIVTSTSNDHIVPPEGDIYSTVTGINKKPKIGNGWTLLEEIKEINSKLLETTIHAMLDPSEDNITIHGSHEGIILKCLFRNVCFPDLLSPYGEISSEKIPEFGILLLVPFDYPASPTTIVPSGQNALKSEPWGKLYKEMLTRFDLSTRGAREMLSLVELAKEWDASARAVMTEFIRKLGGKYFSLLYGTWESTINSYSGSN